MMSRKCPGTMINAVNRGHSAVTPLLRHLVPQPTCHWFSTGATKDETQAVVKTVAKRSRHRFRRMEGVPSYKDFMHRQEVLGLYRQFLRAVRPLPDRKELSAQINKEFSATKNESDPWNRNRAIKEGQRRFKDLQSTLSTSVTLSAPAQQEESSVRENQSKVGKGWPWERN